MTTLNPAIVGQAENAHRAILERALSGTGLAYPDWVALKVGTAAPLAGALKIDQAVAQQVIDALTARGLLADGGLTPEGRELHDRLSAEIGAIVAHAYAGIPVADLTTAAQVLTQITTNLDTALA